MTATTPARAHLAMEAVPPPLERLLVAQEPHDRSEAWDALIAQHSTLLLRVARAMGGDQDDVMDRYAFVLEKLQQDDFSRLRAYTPDGRAKFTTWLVVVARRLCLDQFRERYGRPRGQDAPTRDASRARRRLQRLWGGDPDLIQIADLSIPHPADAMQDTADAEALRQGLEGLSPEDRLLIRLRFEDGLPAREIASLLRFPTLFHVYRRINLTLSALREQLTSAGVHRTTRDPV